MLTGEIRNQIDQIWNAFWSGGVANPLSVIEQITYLLFIKRLDELQTLRGEQGADARQADGAAHLPRGQGRSQAARPYEDLRWSRFKNFEPREMFEIVAEHVFPFLRTLGEEGSSYGRHMKDARFGFPTPALLAKVVDMLDEHPDGGPRHQGRRLRIHARQDRHRRAERPVPHAAPHHRG